jgi:uncharacterized protein YjbI with pentapeptide repeats
MLDESGRPGARYRRPTEWQLWALLQHQIWLRTEGRLGRRFELRGQGEGRRVIKDIDLGGVDLSKSVIENVTFLRGRMKETKFADSEQRGVVYSACDVENADFTGAKLRNVSFHACNRELARFDNAVTENVTWDAEPPQPYKWRRTLHKLDR